MDTTVEVSHSTAVQVPTNLATLDEYSHINLGGYDWTVWNFLGRKQLTPHGEKELTGCKVYEEAIPDGPTPMFSAELQHETLTNLSARSGLVTSLAEAVQWAAEFRWATRKAGGLMWLAKSPDSVLWHARIGTSEAEIFHCDSYGKYIVRRSIRFGNQVIKLELNDLSLGDETRVITTFEQASAIALTMTDYVLELMRNVEHSENP